MSNNNNINNITTNNTNGIMSPLNSIGNSGSGGTSSVPFPTSTTGSGGSVGTSSGASGNYYNHFSPSTNPNDVADFKVNLNKFFNFKSKIFNSIQILINSIHNIS